MANKKCNGKLDFYRHLELEKDDFKLLTWYQRIKNKMVRDEKDVYANGKIHKF